MNKKIILFAAGAVLLAASAFTFASVNKSNDPMDDLFKANVEALAYNESGSEVVKCYCKTKWFSPNVCSVQGSGGYCGGNPCSNYDVNCR